MRDTTATLGMLALVCTAVLWGSNHVVARAVHDTVPLAALVFWRWALALMVLWPLALGSVRRDLPEIRSNLADLLFIGAIGVGLFSVLLLAGAYHSLAIEVGIINATTPAWVAVIMVVTGRAHVPWTGWTGLAIAFLGTALIITQGSPATLFGLDMRIGNLWALLASIAFAWFSVRLRPYTGRVGPLAVTVITASSSLAFVALPLYLGAVIIAGQAVVVHRSEDLAFALSAIGFISLGPTMIANLLYIFGVSRIGPERAAAFIYLSPVASSILSVAFLGEQLVWFHFAGFLLIVVGLVMINRPTHGMRWR